MNLRITTITLSLFLLILNVSAQVNDTLHLNQAVALALKNNYDISLAADEAKVAGINNVPGSVGMLPRLDLSGTRSLSINNSHQQYYDGRTRDGKNAKTNSQNAGIQLSWTFFDGMNMFIQKDKLNEMEQLSNIQLRSVVENTVALVITGYYNIVVQQKLANVYHEALLISLDRQKLAKAGFELGSGSELAYLQSTVDMNADSANYIKQLAVVENAQAGLNQLLCRDLKTSFAVDEEIPLDSNLVYDDIWNKVQQQSPSLLEARGSSDLAALAVKEVKSSLYPTLSLNSGYNYNKSASDVGIYTLNRNLGFTVGVTLNYNIFNGFDTRRKLSIARIQEESAKKDEQRVKLDIEANLQQVFNDFKTNLQLVTFDEGNIQFAKHNFSVAQEKYRLGTITDVELRETQQKLMDAENSLLNSYFLCKSAEVELLRISGQLTGDTGN